MSSFKVPFSLADYKDILPSMEEYLQHDFVINGEELIKGNVDNCVWKKVITPFEETKSLAKDNIISNLNQQIGIYREKEKSFENIIFLKNSQIDLEQEVGKKLAKDLRAVKRKRTFMQIAGTAIIGGLTYLYITK